MRPGRKHLIYGTSGLWFLSCVKSFVVIGTITVGVWGCAQQIWEKPGATEAQLTADRRECGDISREQARQAERATRPRDLQGGTAGLIQGTSVQIAAQGKYFRKCMEERGYTSK